MDKKNSALLFPVRYKLINADPASVLEAHLEHLKEKPDVPDSIRKFLEDGVNSTKRLENEKKTKP